ncbi:SufBD protein [Sphingomonas antarctica]|uniref:SufD family Fe-S cluster assembly protein n=1 Tax=Sphingomonas antarctica TaxID=2040274 RepID=UPI0039EA60F0
MPAQPTPRDEAYRYSDHAALAELWPVAPAEQIEVTAAVPFARSLIVDGATAVHSFEILLHENARAHVNLVNRATRYGRIAIDVTLHEGAHFELGAVQVGGGDTTLEIVTTIRHAHPNASSRQTVRSVLAGHATGSYLGKVAVSRGADGTDGQQSVRAMLLDRTATANAKPELEIYADDVKCAHGCAIGELDANALFYLNARGIPPAEAKRLLLQAFVAEALGEDQTLIDAAQAALAAVT